MTQIKDKHIDEFPQESVDGFRKLFIIILLLIGIVAFRGLVIERTIVEGNSMADTFFDGEVLFARKFNVNEQSIKRFDVVNIKLQNGKKIIKRIIGLPGETIQIIGGYVYVDGKQLEDDYGEQIIDSGKAAEPVVLSENEFFVLGDNRNNSADSRSVGPIKIEQIKGVNFYRIFPIHRIGAINTVVTEE